VTPEPIEGNTKSRIIWTGISTAAGHGDRLLHIDVNGQIGLIDRWDHVHGDRLCQ